MSRTERVRAAKRREREKMFKLILSPLAIVAWLLGGNNKKRRR